MIRNNRIWLIAAASFALGILVASGGIFVLTAPQRRDLQQFGYAQMRMNGYTACLSKARLALVKLYSPLSAPSERALTVMAFAADCARMNDIPTFTATDIYFLSGVSCCPPRNGPRKPMAMDERPPGPTIFDSPKP